MRNIFIIFTVVLIALASGYYYLYYLRPLTMQECVAKGGEVVDRLTFDFTDQTYTDTDFLGEIEAQGFAELECQCICLKEGWDE